MLIKQIENYNLYLCSQSPRRKELLKGMDLTFEVLKTNVEESYPPSLSPVEIAEYLSNLKLSAIPMDQYPDNSIFIGCDTIVVMDQKIMGKPANEKEAFEIISQLSGKKHNVITGVTVASKKRKITSHRTTIVSFKEFTPEEIDYYIKKYKPFDKAGGYGIQEWIGFIGIDYIEGSFYNVMGFPTKLVYDMLTEIIQD